MSKPSPEAKQAARECCEGLLDEAAMAHIIQQAIDTVTAKLREYYEGRMTTEWHKGFAACAEAHEQNKLAHQQPSVIRRNPNEDHRAAQPSAPTADARYCPKCGAVMKAIGGEAHGCECGYNNLGCKTATTTDVEKIAREGLEDIRPFLSHQEIQGSVEESETHGVLLRVAAQARAPLVAAGKQAIPRLERCMCAGSDGRRLNLKIAKTLAALTGTGEK